MHDNIIVFYIILFLYRGTNKAQTMQKIIKILPSFLFKITP